MKKIICRDCLHQTRKKYSRLKSILACGVTNMETIEMESCPLGYKPKIFLEDLPDNKNELIKFIVNKLACYGSESLVREFKEQATTVTTNGDLLDIASEVFDFVSREFEHLKSKKPNRNCSGVIRWKETRDSYLGLYPRI